jgi:hypothetical protein
MIKSALSSLLGTSMLVLVGCNAPQYPTGTGGDVRKTALVSGGTASNLSGSHYSLNLIGMPKNKTADMTGDQGRRIFVNLTGKTQISLKEGDFQVLDANGTDGSASFQLPNPDPDNDGITTYSVWVRALGKPGGSARMTTAATDPVTGETIYSLETTVLVRTKGGSKFADVSKSLLYVYADLDGDGTAERYPLFDDALQNYFWDYDNNGLKLVQMRFYPIGSNVN